MECIDTFQLNLDDPEKLLFQAHLKGALPCMYMFEMKGSAHILHTEFEIIAPVKNAFCEDDIQLLNVCVSRIGISGNTFTFKLSKLGRSIINFGRDRPADTHTSLDNGHRLLEGILNDPDDDMKFWNGVCAFIDTCKTIKEIGMTDDPSKRPVAQLTVLVSICLIDSILQ